MTRDELTEKAKNTALKNGADLVGVVKVSDLPEHHESIMQILPAAESVMVFAARHSLSALRAAKNQMAQFDTIYTYNACESAAHAVARFFESQAYGSVAVPAFIPIDMAAPKYGMRGEICWRRAGVRSGLGSYGENGLLVTRDFGSAIRLAGLVTTAELKADSPLSEDMCTHCMACVEACPAMALSGEGRINKKFYGYAFGAV